MYNVVQVRFEPGAKQYSYFTDLNLVKGDKCVVCVSNEFKIVTVSKVKGLSRDAEQRSHSLIVQRVEKEAWQHNIQQLGRVNQIKAELRDAKKKFEDTEVYNIMSNTNPRVRELLRQLSELGESVV